MLSKLNGILEGCTSIVCAAAKVVVVLSLAALVLDLGAGSIMRYTIKYVPAWYEEAAKIFLVWLTFSGSIVAASRDEHIAIDIFSGRLGPRGRALLNLLVSLLILLTAWVVCQYGWRFAQGGWRGVFPTLDWLPLFYAYVAVPVGYMGIGLVGARNLVRALRELATPQTA